MENRELLVVYAWAWILYVVGIHRYAQRKRLSHPIVVVSHAARRHLDGVHCSDQPRCATTRQFVAGSERGTPVIM